MKCVLLAVCALWLSGATWTSANAWDGDGVYWRQRQRMLTGGHSYGHSYYGHSYYGHSNYGGYYYQPQLYGSWYARPYPTHLDYFRLRVRTPPITPPVDCPCAEGQQP